MNSNLKPIAHITVGKNRTKKGHDVFLKDGVEFEIELYNPTQKPVMAKIKINGSYISNSGVVIKPAQRVYLERYLDEPKKFKFETYEVSGSKEEIQHAIKNNGLVEIEFYNEFENKGYTLITGNGNDIWRNPYLDQTYPSFPPTFYCSTSIGNDTLSFNSSSDENTKSINETGRIESGSNSNQEFEHVNLQFEQLPSTTVEYHILPYSQKPITAKDLNIQYCTGCGLKKRKTTWKFCPKCGTKF